MTEPFDFISMYFWAIALAMGPINAVIMYARTKCYRQANPALTAGYKTLLKRYLILPSIPWVIMGWGISSGQVASVWQYLHPRAGGLFVESFFFCVVCLWLLFSYWIFLAQGAETLAKYPGLFNLPVKSVEAIKFFCYIFMLIGLVFFPFLWLHGFPVPK